MSVEDPYDSMARFRRLEVDDLPSRADLDAKEAAREAEVAREAEAARLRLEEEAEASRRRQEVINAEADAMERRNSAVRDRAELRKAKVVASRKRKSAKDNANKAIYDLNRNHYWDDLEEGTEAIMQAVRDAGFEIGEVVWRGENGNRKIYTLDLDDEKNYGLSISTYQMQSGRWEITSYVS